MKYYQMGKSKKMDIIREIKHIPEWNLIFLCICTKPDQAKRDRIKSLVNSSLDWDLIYEISLRHKIFPLFYKNIKELLPDDVPDRINKKLKKDYFNNAVKNFYYTTVLVQIIDYFQMHDISTVPFKGPVLAQDIYGNLELRQFSDLDILVDRHDAVNAWEILIKKGFKPHLNLNSTQKYKYIKTNHHITFLKNEVYVELHWEMSGFYISKPLILKHISKELNKIEFADRKLSNLCPEHLLVYLCIHGAKHGWGSIEQICCVAGAIQKNIDWKFVENIALRWKCHKMLHLGLYLSWQLLDAPVPDNILNHIKKDKMIARLSQEVASCMFKDYPNSKANNTIDKFASFHIRIRDSFTDKLRYILKLTFRPTIQEWLYFPVPAHLSFLHFFLRPYRLMMETLRRHNT